MRNRIMSLLNFLHISYILNFLLYCLEPSNPRRTHQKIISATHDYFLFQFTASIQIFNSSGTHTFCFPIHIMPIYLYPRKVGRNRYENLYCPKCMLHPIYMHLQFACIVLFDITEVYCFRHNSLLTITQYASDPLLI